MSDPTMTPLPAPQVVMNDFARKRHRNGTGFSYYMKSESDLLSTVALCMAWGLTTPGPRDGILLVNMVELDLPFFVGTICQLTEETSVIGTYMPRAAGEVPRKGLRAGGRNIPLPILSCQIVVYTNAVLAETGSNDTDPADGEVWEIVSINASPAKGGTPETPMTMIHNHLELDGGTTRGWTDEQFVEALRESMAFWHDKAMLAPGVM